MLTENKYPILGTNLTAIINLQLILRYIGKLKLESPNKYGEVVNDSIFSYLITYTNVCDRAQGLLWRVVVITVLVMMMTLAFHLPKRQSSPHRKTQRSG